MLKQELRISCRVPEQPAEVPGTGAGKQSSVVVSIVAIDEANGTVTVKAPDAKMLETSSEVGVKLQQSDDPHLPDVILVIFDPSSPMPPIRPFWENTNA